MKYATLPTPTASVGTPILINRGDLDTKQEVTNDAYNSFKGDLKSSIVCLGSDPTGDFEAPST